MARSIVVRRSAPAVAILTLGLVLGLLLGSATAVASGSLGSAAVKKIVRKQVTKLAPKLTVGDANHLGGAPASEYVRTSGVRADGVATSADVDITTGPVVLLSKTISAPTDGYAFVIATLSGRQKNAGAYGLLNYWLAVDGVPLTPDALYHSLVTHDENFGDNGAISVVVPLTTGQHTIALQVGENGAGTVVTGRDLSVLFTPSGSAPTLPY